jgi:hypothetical protein
VAVEECYDTGEYERVYNLKVSDFHTYFVGCDEWGFSVWAHNLDACVLRGEIETLKGQRASLQIGSKEHTAATRRIQQLEAQLPQAVASARLGVPAKVSDEIARVRAAHGDNCMRSVYDLETALPGGRARPIAGQGLRHEVYHYQGKVIDPTARQYVKPAKAGVWTQKGLAEAGLKDAVDSGVFTPQQHQQFLRKLNERFPGVIED